MAAAAAAAAVVGEAERAASQAAAGRRLALQQSKWAVVEMQQQNKLARRASLHKLVVGKWQHRDLSRAFDAWLRFPAQPPPRNEALWRSVNESKWAMQSLRSERIAAETKRRGWAMSRLVGVLTHSTLGDLGAAFHAWAYHALEGY